MKAQRIPTLVFDDGQGLTAPLTDLRASFLVRTGAFTTLERYCHDRRLSVLGVVVAEKHVTLTREQTAVPVNQPPRGVEDVVLVNGRCALVPIEALGLKVDEAITEEGSGDLIAARVKVGRAMAAAGGERSGLKERAAKGAALISRPWHVRTFRDACLAVDVEACVKAMRRGEIAAGVNLIGPGLVCVEPTARVYPGVTIDTEGGPVVVDQAAVVRPGAILIGPCFVGQHSTVLERATIRGQTAIGPWCKVNGEVGGTIFQGFSNKAHDGYLGDSWVGEWVNLGAGTTNSNLLNTYSEVIARATAKGKNERTGEVFLGAIIGDHVKTAICTRIMTGSVLHTGSMFATTAPVSGTVGPLTWATDEGERAYRIEKFVEVMRAAMARRKVEPTAAYLERVRVLAVTKELAG